MYHLLLFDSESKFKVNISGVYEHELVMSTSVKFMISYNHDS